MPVFCVDLEVHISVLVANYSCSFELVVGRPINLQPIFKRWMYWRETDGISMQKT